MAFNSAGNARALDMLQGIYEHAPWIAQAVLAGHPLRPGQPRFASLAALRHALFEVVQTVGRPQQMALIQSYPEFAAKSGDGGGRVRESRGETAGAGPGIWPADDGRRLQTLVAAYRTTFGFPFVLAVRGQRGPGLDHQTILATLERRLFNHPDIEIEEALRNIHRIAELRLNDRFTLQPLADNLA